MILPSLARHGNRSFGRSGWKACPCPAAEGRNLSELHVILSAVARWKRVTNPTANEVLLMLFFVAGATFTAVISLDLFGSPHHWQGIRYFAYLGIYGFLGLWLTFAWRMTRVGLCASSTALRIRWIQRTRTVLWADIARIEVMGAPLTRDTIWLTLKDGQRIETPIQRLSRQQDWVRGTPSALAGPAWENPAYIKNIGPRLRSRDFDRAVNRLRHQLRR